MWSQLGGVAPDVTSLYFEAEGAPLVLPRHRHGLDRETGRASQELRILRATAEVVASKGYAATRIAAIVQKAGVSTKTFYDLTPTRRRPSSPRTPRWTSSSPR
jgi:hypothetical protein